MEFLKMIKMIKTFTIFRFVFLTIMILAFQSCIDDIDDNLKRIDTNSLIKPDDELIKLLEKVVNVNDDPLQEIVCIDFVYPLTLLVYDQNYQVTGTQTLIGDNQFSAFLGSLTDTQYISISYPIATTLTDGTTFSVNNNQELKIAIESCSREDILQFCSNLFGSNPLCVWEVSYSENSDNTYSSGVFTANGDGTINFNFNDQNYTGTWTFLFVNDKLQLNINLEGTSEVAQYWNFSKKIEIIGETITIKNDPKNIILQKKCEETTSYTIGSEDLGGGIVFYDKGSYSDGWRYIEMSSANLLVSEWGCSSSMIENTAYEIGKGFYNSVQIANFHDNLVNYYTNASICNASNDGTVIAKIALSYEQQNFKDWFLPSELELRLIYENLYTQNLGSLAGTTYWTSTEIDVATVKGINFITGETTILAKNPDVEISARAVRYF